MNTSEGKYTKGPWVPHVYGKSDTVVYTREEDGSQWLSQALCIGDAPSGKIIATITRYAELGDRPNVGYPQQTEEELWANFRLIKAAPNMLAALQEILTVVENTWGAENSLAMQRIDGIAAKAINEAVNI